jgi:predicted phosphodiesterase
MVKIWVISDLHYEILGADVTEHLPRPEADVLVIAGDYYRARLAVPRARLQFPGIPLVMIAGNHEHYRNQTSVSHDIATMREDSRFDREERGMVTHSLENETVELALAGEKVRFIGATLWTDFGVFGDWSTYISYAQRGMNDYVYIRGDRRDGGPLEALETRERSLESRRYIESELRKPFDGKTVVVTHHLPSLRSVAARFRNDPLTAAFASDCDDLLALGADLWVHGHTHDSADYVAGKARVVCNPRGYPARFGNLIDGENERFKADLVVEI